MAAKPPYVCHVNENIEGAIYIGRENGRKRLKRSKWHNPYKIGGRADRGTVVLNYRLAVNGGKMHGLLRDLNELTGKPLACWCRRSDEPRTDDTMCHGDVLVELWKEQNAALGMETER